MNLPSRPDHDELLGRIERDLLDSYDEELEMEIEDRDVDEVLAPMPRSAAIPRNPIASVTSGSCSASRANWSSCRTGCPPPDRRS